MNPEMASPADELTLDALFEGRLLLHQPGRGFRFAVDAPLLAWFSRSDKPVRSCVDLGAGCGVVGLGLLAAGAAERLVAVEIQPRLAELVRRNAALNDLADRVDVIEADLLDRHDLLPHGSFQLVVTNPPYWRSGTGQLPSDEERRIACHEGDVTLERWIGRAGELLDPQRGRLCAVFPARRVDELLAALARDDLAPSRLLPVHPRSEVPAELVLVEARVGRPGRVELGPPLILECADGGDTDAAATVLSGRFSATLRARGDRRTG